MQVALKNILTKEVLSKIPNFSKLDKLPIKTKIRNNKKIFKFIDEKIIVKPIDYYFTNQSLKICLHKIHNTIKN